VQITPRPVSSDDLERTSRLTRALFASRRKTIANNVAGVAAGAGVTRDEILAAWEALGVSPSARAETLEPATLLEMARALPGVS
jgi:16S rRNA A1518/A1519 N6-dimethyltransferase RsmA/KsgA/DIM1 with predicted DNA glycosylase/AP lyase activity